ncbi:unnamed protein product [Angiostrongylus costaricensis]|uniref:Exonuclease domain-containing protein n=1 Tax=Angiostrongylus costaricensis TaxID=334426 RepID=A0A0R3PN11_ANGCS|nr:unnamed protein product [Angiostrongylus costaricensis]
MANIRPKGAALKVDPKDVSPAWKVLKMTLKEQAEEAETKNNRLREEADVHTHGTTLFFLKEGKIVFDKYVKPKERVTDFRTSVSGIRPTHIANGSPFDVVQREVAKILKDRIVVLNLHHNRKLTRDTAKCALLRKMANCNGVPSLKKLASTVLGVEIQQGEHDSVVDARVALRLYLTVKKKWESDIKRFRY